MSKFQYLPLPDIPLPTPSPKGNYGPVLLEAISELFDDNLFVVSESVADYPKTFETLSVNQGLVLYETELPSSIPDEYILSATTKDRGLVYVNKQLRGTLSRTDKKFTLLLEKSYGDHLRILIENQGRLNYGDEIRDHKVSNENGSEFKKRNTPKFIRNHRKFLCYSSTLICRSGY